MGEHDERQTSDVEIASLASDPPERRPRPLDLRPASPALAASTAVAPSVLDFRTIFELEVGYVMRTLRRLGIAPADLEDLAHDLFLGVYQQLHTYDRSRPLRPWLFGFAFRIASHYRRRAGRETTRDDVDVIDAAAEAPDALLERERRRRLVLAALEQVELSRRAVFVLHELDGVTCEEVARTLEIPVGTVYSRLRLARQDFSSAVTRLRARKASE
jgi:RNA polymerase sigma-70 factor, ECF subfamily